MRKLCTHSQTRTFVEPLEKRLLASTTLYACDELNHLFTLETSTGQTNVIGDMGVQMSDIAENSRGALYGVDDTSTLYQINTHNGAITRIGALGVSVGALAFASDGTLYAGSDKLYQVNTRNGSSTLIGSFGSEEFQTAGDLAFDNRGRLYIATLLGKLERVNPATGAARVVGEVSSFLSGMALGSDGVMYAMSEESDTIFSIDLTAGKDKGVSHFLNQQVIAITGAASAPPIAIPSAPASIYASDGKYTHRIKIVWTAVQGAISYDIFRGTVKHSKSAVRIASEVTTTHYIDSSIRAGKRYFYWVRARNRKGVSPPSLPDIGSAK